MLTTFGKHKHQNIIQSNLQSRIKNELKAYVGVHYKMLCRILNYKLFKIKTISDRNNGFSFNISILLYTYKFWQISKIKV